MDMPLKIEGFFFARDRGMRLVPCKCGISTRNHLETFVGVPNQSEDHLFFKIIPHRETIFNEKNLCEKCNS